MRRFSRTRLPVFVVTALGYMVSIGLVGAAMILVLRAGDTPIWALALFPLAWLIAGRQLRGLECLVHEASHFNWHREQRRWNDVLGNLLAAWPMLSTVSQFRAQHRRHHHLLGSASDPCRVRMAQHELGTLSRESLGRLLVGALRRYPAYTLDWLRMNAAPGRLVAFLIWHGTLLGFGVAILAAASDLDLADATAATVMAWPLAWGLPMVTVLPVLRMLGESMEHRYQDHQNARSLLSGTVSNIGLVNDALIHPFGDGYHIEHHLFPSVPGYRLRQLAKALVELDGSFMASRYVSDGLLAAPSRGDAEGMPPEDEAVAQGDAGSFAILRGLRREPVTMVVSYAHVEDLANDYTVNLSTGGTFVATDRDLPIGSAVQLVLSFPGLIDPIHLAGVVRWVSGPNDQEQGAGIEFTDYDDRVRNELATVIRELRQEWSSDSRHD